MFDDKKKDTVPYHPNDYWDRTRFSTKSSDESSISSLPQYPPRLSITSSSNELPPPSRGRPQSSSSSSSVLQSSQRTYAQELQLRSRSPKLYELRPQDKVCQENKDENGEGKGDPCQRLGAFRSVNPRTSRVGDQELPWKLSIPKEVEDNCGCGSQNTTTPTMTRPTTTTAAPAPALAPATSTATTDNPTTTDDETPQRGEVRTINKGQSHTELPVHVAGDKDDDSGEEVVMSSTAYPGQEWKPAGLSGWEYW